MLTETEIQKKALRKYPEFLRFVVAGGSFFPWDIRFGRPSPTAHLTQLQKEFAALREAEKRLGFTVEWAEQTTSRWGKQSFPQRVLFTDEAGYLGAIGKKREVEAFRANVTSIRKECHELEPWLQKFPHRVAVLPDEWASIMKVCRYFLANPAPGLYARQLPIGVHSKFIDQNHSILRVLLDFLMGDRVNAGASTFEARYHLLEAEPTLRLRFLDDQLRSAYGFPLSDVSAPFGEMHGLKFLGIRCLIVENLMIFLTLPRLANTLAVFGGGKASALMADLPWLKGCQIFYWGDLDDHGYRILSKLRRKGLAVESILMDEEVWRQFGELAHPGNVEPGSLDLHLNPSELNVWKIVRDKKLMLEQELLPQTYIEGKLKAIFSQIS